MTSFDPLPRGMVRLDGTGCTTQRAGHVANPVQARLHHEREGVVGVLEVHGDRVVLASQSEGPLLLANHQPEAFTVWARRHEGHEARLAASMLTLVDGPTPHISVVVGPEPLGPCPSRRTRGRGR